MTKHRWNPRIVAALSFAAAATLSSQVWAEDCETDADCGDGMVCELVGASACAEPPPCPPGENCTDEEPPPCEPEEIYACVPDLVECASDADCADGLACLSFTYEECDDIAIGTDTPGGFDGGSGDEDGGGSDPGAPDPDAPGDTPDEVTCETVTEAFCAPAWIGACETDSDCGDGFTCVEIEECSCSGGGSTGSGGGEVPPEPGIPTPDPDEEPDGGSSDDGFGDDDGEGMPDGDGPGDDIDCTCEGVGEYYCEPIEVSCSDDADCPDSWSCETFSAEVTCTFDAETGEEFCDEGESESYCAPPFWDAWGGAYGAEDERGGVDLGTATPQPTGDSTNDDGESGGSLDASDPRPASEEGCAASGGNAAGGAWLLGLLGLIGIRRRR